jgi:type I restriction enzyme S subunit
MIGGREASTAIIPGRCALSVNDPGTPLPAGWAWGRLSELAELGTGHTPSRKHPEYWGGDVPWIGIRDAGEHHGGVIEETAQRITELGLENSSARLLPKETVCLSRTASVGYVVKMGREMATSQDIVTWSCGDALDPNFLVKALLAEGDDIRRFGEGSTHTTIYFPEVKAFHVSLPPLPEQRRIVSKIDRLSAKSKRARDDLDRVPQLVEKYKQAVLAAAFRGELTRQWRSSIPIADAPQILFRSDSEAAGEKSRRASVGSPSKPRQPKNVSEPSPDHISKMWQIPTGWQWVQVGACAFVTKLAGFEYTKYVKYDPRGDLKVIKAENAGPNGFRETEYSRVRADDVRMLVRSRLTGGEIIVVFVGAGTGNVAIVPEEVCFFLGPNIGMVRPFSEKVCSRYMELFFRSSSGRELLLTNSKAVAQPSISMGAIRCTPIALPSVVEQQQIVRCADKALAWIDRLASEATSARRLVDHLDQAILAKAFRGELVPQDPNDEPASVLLERIRAEQGKVASRTRRGARK